MRQERRLPLLLALLLPIGLSGQVPAVAHDHSATDSAAHDPAAHVEQLLYRSSLQSLLDFVFVLLCQANPDRHRQLAINLERIHHLLES